MSEEQVELCPHDGAPVTRVDRYPGALCDGCAQRATDVEGRAVRLSNGALSGGFRAWHLTAPLAGSAGECGGAAGASLRAERVVERVLPAWLQHRLTIQYRLLDGPELVATLHGVIPPRLDGPVRLITGKGEWALLVEAEGRRRIVYLE